MIHCLQLCLCSGNELSHQQQCRAAHHPPWDTHQSHRTLASPDHRVNTAQLCLGSQLCISVQRSLRAGSLLLMPHPFPSSKLYFKSEVYAVCRKRNNSTRVCSSVFPASPPAMIITPGMRKYYLCHLQFTKETWTWAKTRKRKTKKSWSRRKWKWTVLNSCDMIISIC